MHGLYGLENLAFNTRRSSNKQRIFNSELRCCIICAFLCTGCNSDIWKKIQANILREPLVLLKQTIPQQKALGLSFNLAP